MPLGSLMYAMAAGVLVHAAIVHLGVGLARRPRDPTHIAFSVVAAGGAAFAISTLALHKAANVAQYVAVFRGPWFFSAALTLVAIAWFFAYWTGFRHRLTLLTLTAATGALVIANLREPQGLIVRGVTELQQVQLLGEPLVLHLSAGQESPLVPALNLAVFGYLAVAVIHAVRRHGVRARLTVVASLGVLLVGSVYDGLVDTGVVRTAYLLPVAAFTVVMIMGGRLQGELRTAEAELARFNEDLRSMVADRTQQLQELNADLERRVDELDRLHEIARITAAAGELEAALRDILPVAGTLLGSERATFAVRATDDRAPLHVDWVSHGRDMTTHPPTSVTATPAAAPTAADVVRAPSRSAAESDHVLRVPLRSGDDTFGSLSAERAAPRFTAEERSIAETIAADAAELVLRDELLGALRTAATMEERRRIARELHESVTQTLYAIAMMAEALPDSVDREPMSARQAARQIRQLTLAALAELRALLLELRPERIASMTLGALIHDEAALVTSRFDLAVTVDVDTDDDPATTTDRKVTVYRVVRELLSNITRHADATEVSLGLRTRDGVGELTVVDDGVGFTPDAIGPSHHGLAIVRERLVAVGGDLRLESRPRHGTRAIVRWPLTEGERRPVSLGERPATGADARRAADLSGGIR